MLRIITLNVNGIRSAAKKGLFTWLKDQQADVICLQELKAQSADLQGLQFHLDGYEAYFQCAEKKGYSGVGLYTRHQPKNIVVGLNWELANLEGRYLAINLGNVWVSSLYMPSGSSGEHRQIIKFDFLEKYALYLKNLIAQHPGEHIICGDWNIAHKQIDLKNWRSNQKNSGFLPEERAWMDALFTEMKFIDAFREVNQETDQYTWWSNRGRAYEKNVGWRIDYQVVTPNLGPTVKSAMIYKEQRFSDHAPLIIDYDIIV